MTERGAQIRAWVERQISGAHIRSSHALPGATSSEVLELHLQRNGAPLRVVLRLFTNSEWLAEETDLASHEAAVLRRLAGSGLPVPELIAVDESGAECGVPALLMTRLPGRVELLPADRGDWLDRQADALARIHQIAHQGFAWHYRSWNEDFEPPDWSLRPRRWQRAAELWREGPPPEPPCFLHRDFHPVNILWQHERLSGIVDWVNACTGPASADVSHCRGNLLQMYGPEAADRFLARYREQIPEFDYHPFWDLDALATWLPQPGRYEPWSLFGLDIAAADSLQERWERFLERALAGW